MLLRLTLRRRLLQLQLLTLRRRLLQLQLLLQATLMERLLALPIPQPRLLQLLPMPQSLLLLLPQRHLARRGHLVQLALPPLQYLALPACRV